MSWEVDQTTNIGSDHFPIWCKIDVEFKTEPTYVHHKWLFSKANWDEFQKISEEMSMLPVVDQDVNAININISSLIYFAASQTTPVSEGKRIKETYLSEEFTVENGIPQESVISPVLFDIMINDIFEELKDTNEGLK